MKKTLSIAILMAASTLGAQAQLVVDSLGKVGIGRDTTSAATLTCSANGATEAVSVSNLTNNSSSTTYGINILSNNNQGKVCGMRSRSLGATNQNAYGLVGEAGYATNCVGVYGARANASSVTNSAGIYGCYGSSLYTSFSYSGNYAGYFYGNVRVASGSLYGTVLSPSASNSGGGAAGAVPLSDDRSERVTDKLMQVEAVQFMRDKRDIGEDLPVKEDADAEEESLLTDDISKGGSEAADAIPAQPRLSEIQYGLVAEQLKEVYPELVYEDADGNVSINYVEMIPLLVQSIKELSQELAELKGGAQKEVRAKVTGIEESTGDMDQVRMDQNKPNPFSGSTVVTLNIPEGTKKAAIHIYDLSGKQLQKVDVAERGETNITLYASDLGAGMYIYSLIVDGQVKVTRRMMVSEN